MNVLLISTYELGRQPFGLASPAAWLRRAGAQVTCIDLSREEFREDPFRDAELLAFYVPMHTATRLAIEMLPAVRQLNPRAHLCFYGLYAPVNESHLRKLGVQTILGGEFEEGLTHLLNRLRNTNGGSGSAQSSADNGTRHHPVPAPSGTGEGQTDDSADLQGWQAGAGATGAAGAENK